MKLYPYQEEHYNRLLNILSEHTVAVDSSKTGSGKTIVAIFVAKHLLSTNQVNRVFIVCPPTLCEHWAKYVSEHLNSEQVQIHSSHSLHKVKVEKTLRHMMIVDECHLFKNTVERTKKIKKLITICDAVLMLSATPYDDDRQYGNVKELFHIRNNIKDHLSRMDFDYSTSTKFQYYHILQREEPVELYEKGYSNIYNSTKRRRFQNGEGDVVFNPRLFSAGIHKIHDSLIDGAIQYTEKQLTEMPNHKFVVVLNFVHHFDCFIEAFPDQEILVLNGKTPLSERHRVISKFQEPNLKCRIICISAEVGSVGIELDDKQGQFPRHMIVLPMTNAVNFCQAIGRIQRTQTLSHSTVSVIQPVREQTYFKSQINRKFKVLEQFMNLPEFENSYQEHDKNKCTLNHSLDVIQALPLPHKALMRIQDFLCECI